jgi:hypothetical protein
VKNVPPFLELEYRLPLHRGASRSFLLASSLVLKHSVLLRLHYLSVCPCYENLKVLQTVLICRLHGIGFDHADVSWGAEISKRSIIHIFHFPVNYKQSGILKFLRLGWLRLWSFGMRCRVMPMFRRNLLSVNGNYCA